VAAQVSRMSCIAWRMRVQMAGRSWKTGGVEEGGRALDDRWTARRSQGVAPTRRDDRCMAW
jgi:hypothetical protein